MSGTTRGRVLLLGADPEDRALYGEGLRFAGYSVSFGDAGEPLPLSPEQPPDAIVLHLGSAAGWDVCDDLRRDPTTVDIPVILLTAAVRPDRANRDRARATPNCAAFVGKPCTPQDLDAVIQRVLAGEHGIELADGSLGR